MMVAYAWRHESNIEWLKARRGSLTASSIVALWPETPSGKKRTVTENDYLEAVFKSREVNTLSAYSSGARARGHILEPYAIDEYNLLHESKLFHWDDCIIHDEGVIAFSPDALNIEQPGNEVVQSFYGLPEICEVGEVKSYEADKHFATYSLDQKAPERIQIATQMHVCKYAQKGHLILYNPRLEKGCLLTTTWTRDSLAHEFDIIYDIGKKFIEAKQELVHYALPMRQGPSEAEILERQMLSIF